MVMFVPWPTLPDLLEHLFFPLGEVQELHSAMTLLERLCLTATPAQRTQNIYALAVASSRKETAAFVC